MSEGMGVETGKIRILCARAHVNRVSIPAALSNRIDDLKTDYAEEVQEGIQRALQNVIDANLQRRNLYDKYRSGGGRLAPHFDLVEELFKEAERENWITLNLEKEIKDRCLDKFEDALNELAERVFGYQRLFPFIRGHVLKMRSEHFIDGVIEYLRTIESFATSMVGELELKVPSIDDWPDALKNEILKNVRDYQTYRENFINRMGDPNFGISIQEVKSYHASLQNWISEMEKYVQRERERVKNHFDLFKRAFGCDYEIEDCGDDMSVWIAKTAKSLEQSMEKFLKVDTSKWKTEYRRKFIHVNTNYHCAAQKYDFNNALKARQELEELAKTANSDLKNEAIQMSKAGQMYRDLKEIGLDAKDTFGKQMMELADMEILDDPKLQIGNKLIQSLKSESNAALSFCDICSAGSLFFGVTIEDTGELSWKDGITGFRLAKHPIFFALMAEAKKKAPKMSIQSLLRYKPNVTASKNSDIIAEIEKEFGIKVDANGEPQGLISKGKMRWYRGDKKLSGLLGRLKIETFRSRKAA